MKRIIAIALNPAKAIPGPHLIIDVVCVGVIIYGISCERIILRVDITFIHGPAEQKGPIGTVLPRGRTQILELAYDLLGLVFQNKISFC